MKFSVTEQNKRYNQWTTIEYIGRSVSNNQLWLCRCDCGTERVVKLSEIKRGASKSCGHGGHNYKHGMSRTKTHLAWAGMIQRCTNKNYQFYNSYGGRGITVCDRWKKFENFYEDMGEVPVGLTLERIDVDGNYEPGNCRWATMQEQERNRTNNRLVEYKGIILTLVEWASVLKIDYGVLRTRFYRKWSVERAFEYKEVNEIGKVLRY